MVRDFAVAARPTMRNPHRCEKLRPDGIDIGPDAAPMPSADDPAIAENAGARRIMRAAASCTSASSDGVAQMGRISSCRRRRGSARSIRYGLQHHRIGIPGLAKVM